MKVRTRFAPSPTGELHLGNARIAVLNWAYARRHDGDFVLRFEDTDLERRVERAEERILEGLRWLEMAPDEGPEAGGDYGPYRQSERLAHYREHAATLMVQGRAYNCYCTPEELERRREEALAEGRRPAYDGRCRDVDADEEERLRAEGRRPSVRFRTEPGPVEFTDRVRGPVSIRTREFGDFVILRSDGRPTYNFAVVVDDLMMEITHVIRGVGHLANTPKQVLVYRALGADVPEFVHVPLVLAPGGGKLSKRAGAPGLLEYRDRGYHPDGVLNYLSLLSWSSESGHEVLARERIVEEVDLDRIRPSDTEIDPEKMAWLSGEHVRREDAEALQERLAPFLDAMARREGLELDERDRHAVAEVARERIRLFAEVEEEVKDVFPEPEWAGEALDALAAPEAGPVLTAVAEAWADVDAWRRDRLGGALSEAKERVDAGGRRFYRPVRAALTGRLEGPALEGVAYMLGRRRTLDRLRRARERTEGGRDGETPSDGDAAGDRGAVESAGDEGGS